MKSLKRVLSLLLVAAMLLSGVVLAVEPEASAEPEQESQSVFISLTDASSHKLDFTLSEDVYNKIQGKKVTWTLERTASYANPAGGVAHPLHGESEMYPNEQDTIVLDAVNRTYSNYLKIKKVETTFDDETKTMSLSFGIDAMGSRGNASAPHANGGVYLDVCGEFVLKASVDDEAVELDKTVDVEIKPYPTFHTMWEIYEEISQMAKQGDDDAATALPYIVERSMGQSAAGYDMPYLIIAKDSVSVANWLKLCQRAETEPEAVLAELSSGALSDYQVPVVYSNIHANEVAAADAVLEFARMLMEEEEISYTKLTGLTDAGQEVLNQQREKLGLHTPELVADMTTYLGGILPEANAERGSQNSGKVSGFDSYYNKEEASVNVADLLDDVFFILVPEENVEGRMYVTRTSSGGYDLNRDNSFQTQAECRNMQHLIATYNPVTLMEFHGQVTSYQVEPCSPPHEPNVEYDLLSRHLMTGGEAFGAAAVANNSDWQSYVIPMRDYLTSDKDGNPFWESPWDDMSTSYTPQFAMLQGCVGYTVEMPAYSETGRQADTYGMVGLSNYIAAEKEAYFQAQLEIYARGVKNANSDAEVAPWFADCNDVEGAEADLFRPANEGNGQFFPECYIIPLDSEHQTNLQAAYDMIDWLTRNGVKVGITTSEFTFNGETYPEGTMIVSMYQAKRAVANGVLYDGTVIRNWTDLYSEGITAFNYTRGFDMITCDVPSAYTEISSTVGITLDYSTAADYLAENAKTQFSGVACGDVIISNASEDSVAAVNALLKDGKKVAMVTEGEYEGDFICSYKDYLTVADSYVLTATGVDGSQLTAYNIGQVPTVYISGTTAALTQNTSGYVYTRLVGAAAYNYDRMSMEMMNFNTTEDAAQANAVIGATALDAGGLEAVRKGAPYVGYTSSAANTVNKQLIPVSTASTYGMDCLGYVTYPEKTLVNASYINDGDDVLYGYGTRYFTSVPEGAKILVQGVDTEPMEGFLNGDDASYHAFLGGIKGFSYEGKDSSGQYDINITLFANTMTNKAHQRDEYAFISNAIFAGLLSDEAYAFTPVAHETETQNAKEATCTEDGYTGDEVCTICGEIVREGEVIPAIGHNFVDGVCTNCGCEQTIPFVDVKKDDYFYNAVLWAIDQGITAGTTDTTFSPKGTVTRAEMVTFLWAAAGKPEPEGNENPFVDVPEGAWYAKAVQWAFENGYAAGTDATHFSPKATLTRAQAMTFLYAFAGKPEVQDQTASFTDVNPNAWYGQAVLWAYEQGITAGVGGGRFGTTQTCTRAQVVTFLFGLLGQAFANP